MKGPPTGFWGKKETDDGGQVVAWHPLLDHCADVAACCSTILDKTLIRKRLATLGGLDDLSAVQASRLCFLAALHDIGKFSIGFQNKALAKPHFTCGHVGPVMALLGRDYKATRRFCESLPVDSFLAWGGGTEAAEHLLYAAICHHGRPVPVGGSPQERWWQPHGGLNPFEGIRSLVRKASEWFPESMSSGGDPLPESPAFQHGFNGLVTLADWLGSSERFFPFSEEGAGNRFQSSLSMAEEALQRIGLDPRKARDALSKCLSVFDAISEHSPRETQRQLIDLPLPTTGSVTILEAATGSGKTEAALARYLRMFREGLVDGLYFALPTRTAATQIYDRVVKAVTRAFPEGCRPPVVQAVPGYIKVDDRTGSREDAEGRRLPRFEVLWDDDPARQYGARGWAGEHSKRYLAGSVVVGTVDQALLSSLMAGHAHLRATSLLRHLLVVDEVHASDSRPPDLPLAPDVRFLGSRVLI